MAEAVTTGGVMQFRYERGHEPRLSVEEKRAIAEAYEKAKERKRTERRRRNTIWSVVILIVLIALGYIAWKFNF